MMTAALEPHLQAADLTLATFELLSAIHGAQGKATQADIARRLGVTPPTLSEAVHNALKRNLLEQVSDPQDARLRRLRLTKTGRAKITQVLEAMSQSERDMLIGIDAESLGVAREVLRQAIRNLARSITPPTAPSRG